MTILIVTHSRDNESIPLVIQAIEDRGGKAFRFDTDRFPTESRLDIYYGNGTQRPILASETEELNLQDVTAVWYRRIWIGGRIPTTMEAQLRAASLKESERTIQGA